MIKLRFKVYLPHSRVHSLSTSYCLFSRLTPVFFHLWFERKALKKKAKSFWSKSKRILKKSFKAMFLNCVKKHMGKHSSELVELNSKKQHYIFKAILMHLKDDKSNLRIQSTCLIKDFGIFHLLYNILSINESLMDINPKIIGT